VVQRPGREIGPEVRTKVAGRPLELLSGAGSPVTPVLGDLARAIGITQFATQACVTHEAPYKALPHNGDRVCQLL
jgi:hypothetical protein